jgi:hypothetical protein
VTWRALRLRMCSVLRCGVDLLRSGPKQMTQCQRSPDACFAAAFTMLCCPPNFCTSACRARAGFAHEVSGRRVRQADR